MKYKKWNKNMKRVVFLIGIIIFVIIGFLFFKKKDRELVDIQIITESLDAEIYIDGKKTGKNIKDFNNNVIREIDKTSIIQLVDNTPWGPVKTQEVKVEDVGNLVELNIELLDSEIKDDIINSVNTFLKDEVKVKEHLDIKYYSNLKNPELQKKKKLIEELKLENRSKEIEIKKIVYDLDSIIVRKEEGNYIGVCNLKYDYIEKIKISEDESETIEDEIFMNILLVYEDEKWNIYETELHSDLQIYNKKEFNL